MRALSSALPQNVRPHLMFVRATILRKAEHSPIGDKVPWSVVVHLEGPLVPCLRCWYFEPVKWLEVHVTDTRCNYQSIPYWILVLSEGREVMRLALKPPKRLVRSIYFKARSPNQSSERCSRSANSGHCTTLVSLWRGHDALNSQDWRLLQFQPLPVRLETRR